MLVKRDGQKKNLALSDGISYTACTGLSANRALALVFLVWVARASAKTGAAPATKARTNGSVSPRLHLIL